MQTKKEGFFMVIRKEDQRLQVRDNIRGGQ